MHMEIYQYINNYTTDIIAILIIVISLLTLTTLLQFITILRLKKKYRSFTSLSSEINIEDVLINNQESIKNLMNDKMIIQDDIRKIYESLNKTFESVAMHKYDAFGGMGGKLSAVIVLINKNLDGFLLNSINTREGSHLYTKQIIRGKTEQALSKEEQDTIKMAIEQI
ncbi:DUF4446 family protein [Petrocella sp. FN5]|uniref:DUF4446 family protein n=1 Tax=Petrocella sp. FN5 TaxID=3032002 RepID=UPI0023DC8D4C|nr:DUF4446 family protein [Petrocella sp. FN5]MDF1617428.1 DUF4446 family protein [Petrocella sp. FN5]